jgi:Na+/H+ antiporter NhaD/arsenite permease-like protein
MGLIIGLSFIAVAAAILFFAFPSMGIQFSLAMILTSLILLGVYAILVTEALHRMTLALFGAALIIIVGISVGMFPPEKTVEFVVEAIDFNTIGLLLGMMVIVGVIAETGIFQFAGIKAAKKAKGDVWKIMLLFSVLTAVTSAFLDNVTTVLLMVPVTISISKILSINPIPLIVGQALASNVGGTATLIGDPPNIMVASDAGLTFNDFIIHLAPEVVVTFLVSLVVMKVLFRKYLREKPKNVERLSELDESKELKDRPLIKKSLGVLGGVIVLFVFHGMFNVEPSVIALAGAGLLLVITRVSPEIALGHVAWSTLLFFAGLFVIVSGVEHAGVIEFVAEEAIEISGGQLIPTSLLVIWMSAFASAFIDNIPYTATMIPLIDTVSQDPVFAEQIARFAINPLWWALLIGADLGGNGTLVGASANLVSAGLSERMGYPISFMAFLRVGMPYMIITTAVASAMLMVMMLFLPGF